ncbi:MAG: hypothetical protein IPM73_17045 [Betaproteobacteria bacterium]|nr:hypothetical protein [Betaproteobacteria bacterium]
MLPPTHQEGLVGHIHHLGGDDSPLQGIQGPVLLVHQTDLLRAQAGGLEIGFDFVPGMGVHGDGPPGQIMHTGDTSRAPGQQGDRRMLHEGGESDDGLSWGALDDQGRGAHPDIGPPFHHLPHRVDAGPSLPQADFQARLAIVALGFGSVEGGKLELVLPDQLHDHGLAGDPAASGEKDDEQEGTKQ